MILKTVRLQKTRENYKTHSRAEYAYVGLRRGSDGTCQSANAWSRHEVLDVRDCALASKSRQLATA